MVLSFDRYSRDDVIGEVLLPVYEALEEMSGSAAPEHGNRAIVEPSGGGLTLCRDIAPRSLKVFYKRLSNLIVCLFIN